MKNQRSKKDADKKKTRTPIKRGTAVSVAEDDAIRGPSPSTAILPPEPPSSTSREEITEARSKEAKTLAEERHNDTGTIIIIDNITTALTRKQLEDTTHTKFPGTKITSLPSGGLKISPNNTAQIPEITNTNNYDQNIYGKHIYIHSTDTQHLPWLCINKVPTDTTTDEIRTLLTRTNTTEDEPNELEGLHRKYKGKFPTTLLLFRPSNKQTQDRLTDQQVQISHSQNHTTHDIRTYINTRITHCTKCQRIGHSHNTCTGAQTCVKCGEGCEHNKCKNGNLRKCMNCGNNHPSTHYACPARVQHRKITLETRKVEINTNAQIATLTAQNTRLENRLVFIERTLRDISQKYHKLEHSVQSLTGGLADIAKITTQNKKNITQHKTQFKEIETQHTALTSDIENLNAIAELISHDTDIDTDADAQVTTDSEHERTDDEQDSTDNEQTVNEDNTADRKNDHNEHDYYTTATVTDINTQPNTQPLLPPPLPSPQQITELHTSRSPDSTHIGKNCDLTHHTTSPNPHPNNNATYKGPIYTPTPEHEEITSTNTHTRETRYNEHQNIITQSYKTRGCRFCGKDTRNKDHLREHIIKHHKFTIHPSTVSHHNKWEKRSLHGAYCIYCGTEFDDRDQHIQHIKTHFEL